MECIYKLYTYIKYKKQRSENARYSAIYHASKSNQINIIYRMNSMHHTLFYRFLRRYAAVFALMFCCYIQSDQSSSVLKHIIDQSYASHDFETQEWPDEDFYPYLMRSMQYQYHLAEQKKRTVVFKMLDASWLKQQLENNRICDDTITWQNLNLFSGQADPAQCLCSIIDRTNTAFGHTMLRAMLVNPTIETQELKRRQAIIRYLVDNPDVLEQLDQELQAIGHSENIVMSFWMDDPIRQEIKKERYLQWPIQTLNEYVNKSEFWLSVINSWGHIERLLYLRDYILGAFFVTLRNSLVLTKTSVPTYVEDTATWLQQERGVTAGPILTECLPAIESNVGNTMLGLLAGLYALMGIQDWACWVRDQLYLDSCVHMKMMHAARFVDGVRSLNAVLMRYNYLSKNLLGAHSLHAFLNTENNDIQKLLTLLHDTTFYEKPSFTTHKGRSLLSFKLMNEHKDCFENTCVAIGEIDVYVSMAKLYKEGQLRKARYCFVEHLQADHPVLETIDFWNPFINPQKVVLNSVTLGAHGARGNMIVTGPNAGGKSTILKALALNILLGQSFGIACATSMRFSPFSKVATYMNVKDDIAAGNSLFKAQVLRAQELLAYVKALDDGTFCFIIIDEMFNGTSPVEAEACAYSVAKNFGSNAHVMCLIATHFPLLTKLEKHSLAFTNYTVQVEKTEEGKIVYPFMLQQGVSEQHVALDILKAQGFNGQIVNDAHAMVGNKPIIQLPPFARSDA